MVFYADYEALEFNSKEAKKKGIYPYYLDSNVSETSLCPLFFSACNEKGITKVKQNVFKGRISFLRFLDYALYSCRDDEVVWVWFHNVQYDFRIILHELFYNKFENVLDSESIIYKGDFKSPNEKSFAIVGENLSKYIGINLYYKGHKILIRDTMRIINSAQNKILEQFGYPSKVDVDWKSITLYNLKDNMQLIEDRNVYDVESLAKCIEEFKRVFKEKFNGSGSTAPGMSFDAYKDYLCNIRGITIIDHETKNDVFREYYPKLSDEALDIAKGCYSGGICTMNYKYKEQILNNLQMVDINSSYPYAMTMPLPYGEGVEINDFVDMGYSEYIVFIEFHHNVIPFCRCHTDTRGRRILNLLPPDRIYTRSQFPQHFNGYLCINSIELETLKKYANITQLKFMKGYNYKTNTIMADFIKPVYEERKHSKGVMKMAIKLLLNSLYGKFAQDLSGNIFVYTSIDEHHEVLAIDIEHLYKPLASAITAYARRNWIDVMSLLGDDFVYGDTDSVYFLNVEKNMKILRDAGKIHENELGKWALDDGYGSIIPKAKFISKKNYMLELEDGSQVIKCVGLSHRFHDQLNFDNFVINSIPFKVEKMVNVYGGKAMRETEFKIRERSNF